MSPDHRGALAWPLAFDRPEDAAPHFHDAVDAALAGVRADTAGSFAMLANFRFNHTGYRPARLADLYLGSLRVTRDAAGGPVTATQHDSTSGERWALSIDGGEARLAGETRWQVEAAAEGKTMFFEGWIEDDAGERRVFTRLGGRTRLLSRTPLDRPLLHRPMLFLGIRDLEGAPFDVIDLTHGHESGLQLREVDASMRIVGSTESELVCYAVAGRNSIPTYWWVDPNGRVVAMSGTLWTYVLANPDDLP